MVRMRIDDVVVANAPLIEKPLVVAGCGNRCIHQRDSRNDHTFAFARTVNAPPQRRCLLAQERIVAYAIELLHGEVLAESTGNCGGGEGHQGTPARNAYGNLLILFVWLVNSNPTLSATSLDLSFQTLEPLAHRAEWPIECQIWPPRILRARSMSIVGQSFKSKSVSVHCCMDQRNAGFRAPPIHAA
jgi:hypothetical protein